jgi:thiamine monophosphate kinase
MRLSEAGELGLLRELESRGLIVGTEHDAAELADGLVVTQDALVEGVHFRLDWLSWRELGFRAAAVTLSDLSASAARPEALFVTLTLPGDVELERVLELYEGFAEAGVPVRGGDTSSAGRAIVSVTALGRSDRVPERGRVTSSSSRGRSAQPAPRSGTVATYARRCGRRRVSGSAPWLTRCSTSRTVSRSTQVTSPIAPAVAS